MHLIDPSILKLVHFMQNITCYKSGHIKFSLLWNDRILHFQNKSYFITGVCLCGMGGNGKTTLAEHIGHKLKSKKWSFKKIDFRYMHYHWTFPYDPTIIINIFPNIHLKCYPSISRKIFDDTLNWVFFFDNLSKCRFLYIKKSKT